MKAINIKLICIYIVIASIVCLEVFALTASIILSVISVLITIVLLLLNSLIINSYNKYIDSKLYATRYNNRNNLDRNYDFLNIGDHIAEKAFDFKSAEIKGLNYPMIGQSLSCSFSVLKNYFSIVKPGGIILVPISSNDLLNNNRDQLYELYYLFLHNRLLREKNYITKLKLNFPIIFHPYLSFCILLGITPTLKSKSPILQKNLVELVKSIDEINAFCIERNLNAIVVLMPLKQRRLQNNLDNIKSYFSECSFDLFDLNSNENVEYYTESNKLPYEFYQKINNICIQSKSSFFN